MNGIIQYPPYEQMCAQREETGMGMQELKADAEENCLNRAVYEFRQTGNRELLADILEVLVAKTYQGTL